jgi:hypothetical protein
MLAFGAILTYRLFRASVLAAANDVTVRNFFQTRTLARRESKGFRIGPMSGQPFGQTIHVLLRDDTILPLDATSRPLPFAQGKRILQRQLDTLREWHGGATPEG